MEDADIWFIRFSMDRWCTLLACGSRTGRVFAWDLMAPSDQAARAKTVLRIPSTTPCTVRHPAHPGFLGPCCDRRTRSRLLDAWRRCGRRLSRMMVRSSWPAARTRQSAGLMSTDARSEPLTAALQMITFLTMVCIVGLSVASGFAVVVQAVPSLCIVRSDSMK